MPEARQRYVLFAAANGERGQAMSNVVSELHSNGPVPDKARLRDSTVGDSTVVDSMVVDSVEKLLFHTRGSVPDAMVLEHDLASGLADLDLVSMLRRRAPLAEIPIVYLGPSDPDVHASAISSGADVYLPSPPSRSVLAAVLRRLLQKRASELTLRASLERLRTFEKGYQESERVKDDLTHMLVHDLKSPIASVMGLLDHSLEMVNAGESGEPTAELLGLARTEAQHLLNLAANILDVRRMKEGHMPFRPEPIDNLEELAGQALSDARGGPRDRNFSLLVRDDAQRLVADPALLRRILTNLFANAIKHTRSGGYVDFRAWRQEESFVLSVRDDGEGIPEADHKRIFNAFEQSRHTIHDRYDTGMGLTFCKLAVEKHGGKIWVESKMGRGSTFVFTIPVNVASDSFDDATLGVV